MRKLLFLIMFLALTVNVYAAQLYPLKFHWNTTSGRASGYKVYTCTAGTSCGPGISANDKDTYTTPAQGTTNANPVVLDSRGEADIFFNGLYKIVVCDTNDANCVTEDNWGSGYTVTSTAASATNLIPNASFETDTNSDSTPDSWVLTGYTGSTNTLDTSDQYHGAQSGKFVSVGNGGGYYTSEDYIEITEGRTYTLSFAVKSSVVDVRNLVQIQYFTSAKASVSTVSIWDESAANPTSWTIKEFQETPPGTARFAKLTFYGAHSSDATSGTTRYDDVRMIVKGVGSGGVGAYSKLAAQNDGSNPTYQIDVTADAITLDDGTNIYQARTISVTCDITASGANGLDSGSRPSGTATAYDIYVIYNDTDLGCLLTTAGSAPTMPSGYTYKFLVSSTVTDASSPVDFRNFKQLGERIWYDAHEQVATGLTSATFTKQALSAVIPTTSNKV